MSSVADFDLFAETDPPSPPVTLNTTITLGALTSSVKVHDVVSTIDGPFCYIYE